MNAIIIHYTGIKLQERKFRLVLCKGCKLNKSLFTSYDFNTSCSFRMAKKNIRGVKYLNSRKSKEDLVPYNYKIFEKNIKKELIYINSCIHFDDPPPPQPTIIIQDLSLTLISRWFKSKAYKDLLLEAVLKNQEKDNKNVKATYEFYTNGSLKDRGSLKSAMGSSWIQTLGPNPNTIFKMDFLS